jgi:hypothetical protein
MFSPPPMTLSLILTTMRLHESLRRLRNFERLLVLTNLARAHFPSKTSVGGSMSLLKASAVLAKPRWASAPL